jgi:hypothetical protein
MVFSNPLDYFKAVISVISALLPEAKKANKLTNKEIEFLALCAVYNYNGNNLEKFSGLSKFIIESKHCQKKKAVSFYKTKLASKNWIKADKDTFILPNALQNVEDAKNFEISLANGKGAKVAS